MTDDDRRDDRQGGLTRGRLLQNSLAAGAALSLPGLVGADVVEAAIAATPRRGGRLRVGSLGGNPGATMNPGTSPGGPIAFGAMNLYDRLLTREVFKGDPSHGPGLAQSFEPNRDGSVWNVKLRSGVEFHNGKTLTADDIVGTFQRYLRPNAGNQTGAWLGEIVDIKKTRKVGKLELQIGMKSPSTAILYAMQSWDLAFAPAGMTDAELARRPIGTGPFKLVRFQPGQQALFARHPNYFVEGKPYLDELQLIIIDDATARFNALQTGQIDAMQDIGYATAAANRTNKKIKILRAPGAAVVAFYMRQAVAPFKDNRVRTAFKLAIDRKQMVNIIYRGFGTVANDVWGKGWTDYNDKIPQRQYDPERAKALLADAGFRDGIDVELITSTAMQGMLESAQAYAEQAKAAGIRIKLKQIPASDYFNSGIEYLKAPFYQTSWGARSFEGVFQYVGYCNLKNEIDWCNHAWEKRFKAANATLNTQARYEAYKKLQVDVWRQSGYIIWGYGDHLDAARPNVMGFTPATEIPFGDANFKNMWLA